MRKDALTLTISTLVAGIFGAFLRWLQNLNAFEEDTGLFISGKASTWLLVIYLIIAAGLIAAVVFWWLRRYDRPSDMGAFGARTVVPNILSKALGVITALACIAIMFAANSTRLPTLQRVFAALGILAGAAMLLLFSSPGVQAPYRRQAGIVISLFCCLWLITSYKFTAEDPVVWAFVIEILAVCAVIMAWYELAAYSYGRAKPDAALFFVMLAAVLCITTLSDSRSFAWQLLFFSQTAMLLMHEYLMIENMKDKRAD